MNFLGWLQSFFGHLILWAALLVILAWAFLQGGETASTAVFIMVLIGSIGREALKSSG